MAKSWFFSRSESSDHHPDHTGKYHQSSVLFPFSWEQVAVAFWFRYPNPHSLHVLSEDVIERRVTDDQKLITKRLLSKTNRLPKWGEKFMRGPQNVLLVEESILDLKEKTLTTYTRNIGYTKVMTVDEKCWYKPIPEDPAATELSRSACIESHVFGFSKAIQTFGVERYKRNTAKTVDGFLYVLEHLFAPLANIDKVPDSLSSRISSWTLKTESFRDSARKAKELAKQKTSDLLHVSKSSSSNQ